MHSTSASVSEPLPAVGGRASRAPWLWIGLAAAITAASVWVVLFDVIPKLRGPAPYPPEWEWPWEPILWSNPRTWMHLGLVLAYCTLVALLMRPAFFAEGAPLATRRARVRWGLIAAVLFFGAWELSLAWARRGSLLDLIIFRVYSPPGNGYFMSAVRAEGIRATLNDYAAAMPNFPHDRPQTHPPGIFIYYSLFIALFERMPDFSAWFAPIARGWETQGRDWVLLRDPYIPAAFFSGWVQVLSACFAPVAFYFLLRRLEAREGHARGPSAFALWGALLIPLLPPVGSFYTHWDLNYLLLTAGGWFFALRAQDRTQAGERGPGPWLDWLWAGLLLCLLTWLSFGNAIFGLIVGLHLLWRQVAVVRPPGAPFFARATLGRFLAGGVITGAAVVLPWLLAYATWGMNYFELLRVGMAMHYEIVTAGRDYSIWWWMNLVDFARWTGFGVVLLSLAGSVWLLRNARRGYLERNLAGLVLIFWGVLLFLDFSGTARGEIGRLWIFLMPFPLIFALAYLRTYGQRLALLGMLAASSWVMAHALRAV